MIRWSVSTNDIYYEAWIRREEGPWWIFCIEWLSMQVCWLIGKLPIPFPNWTITRDSLFGCKHLDEDEVTTMREYYGDFSQFYHGKVCNPIFQWCDSKYEATNVVIDLEDVPQEWVSWEYEDDEEAEDEDTNENCMARYGEDVQKLYNEFLDCRNDERFESLWRSDMKDAILDRIKENAK